MAGYFSKYICKAVWPCLLLWSFFLCVPVFGDVIVTSSKNIPADYENIIKKEILQNDVEIFESVHVVLGEEALIEAIETLPENSTIVAAYVSRYSYETIMIEHYQKVQRLSVSVLYFDPSPQQQLTLANSILSSQKGIFDSVYLNGWLSEHWAIIDSDIDVRTRKADMPFKSLLDGGYYKKIFILPADQNLFEDIVFGDLITLLIENRSGLITFSPNIRNSLASVYFDVSDYAAELVLAINNQAPFKMYPQKAKYTINLQIAQAIGIKPYSLIKKTGYLHDIPPHQ